MKSIINFLTGTYNRKLILQSVSCIVLVFLTTILYGKSDILGLIPFIIGGILTITAVLLVIEYVRHAFGRVVDVGSEIKSAVVSSRSKSFTADGGYSGRNDSVEYIGPSDGAIAGLIVTMVISFVGIMIGVLVGLMMTLDGVFEIFSGDGKYNLEFRIFHDFGYILTRPFVKS